LRDAEETLRTGYRAFNARDVEAAVELMHPEVDWPNAWEGGRVVGPAVVGDHWNRQFAAISSKVEPERFTEEPDGSITVDVHHVVHDARTGELISDSRVRHHYRLEDDWSSAWTSSERLAGRRGPPTRTAADRAERHSAIDGGGSR
jgi:hypothetical protein